jgi:hypothetical protein
LAAQFGGGGQHLIGVARHGAGARPGAPISQTAVRCRSGGARESEAPGIYANATPFISALVGA